MFRAPVISMATGALLLVLCGCGGNAGMQGKADALTRAVYNNDATAASTNFDDALKSQVTRASVGQLSDVMHKFGDYKGLTYLSTDPKKNEFDFRANFSNGAMLVVLRSDAQGKVTAYRIFPLHQ